jgi:NAD(P)-dependent dehydrogenase (short-subunit alcohol dehydrogenase family)
VRFAGKVAFVTGAGSGIGRATALAYAGAGARVACFDVDGQACRATGAEIIASGGESLAFEGSIADARAVDQAISATVSAWQRLDFLFNNAGCEFVAPLLETTEDEWDKVFDTNAKGTYLVTKAALPAMLRTGYGVITNNASDAGLRGIKLNAAYSSSKAAIIHLTRSLALDYAKMGIRTNCICPGCIRTPLCERFNEEVAARKGKTGDEVLAEFVAANIPMGRVGEPDEVASVVLFLSSDEARYINGAVIPIDGGLTAGM